MKYSKQMYCISSMGGKGWIFCDNAMPEFPTEFVYMDNNGRVFSITGEMATRTFYVSMRHGLLKLGPEDAWYTLVAFTDTFMSHTPPLEGVTELEDFPEFEHPVLDVFTKEVVEIPDLKQQGLEWKEKESDDENASNEEISY